MLKRNGQTCKIKEQYIIDPVTELTLVFRVTPQSEAGLHLLGDSLPLSNRDFQFNEGGTLVGTGTGVCADKCNFS